MMEKHKEPSYLGDGVYIKADAFIDGDFVLTTGSHKNADAHNRIHLESAVWKKLVEYLREYNFIEHGIYNI